MLLSLLSPPPAATPSELDCLVVFRRDLGGEEDAERKVVCCFPEGVALERQLAVVGLCDGMLDFARTFAAQPCHAVHTHLHRYTLVEAEEGSGTWACLVTRHAKRARSRGGEAEAREEDLPDGLLRERLALTCATLRLFVGSLDAAPPARALREAVCTALPPLCALLEAHASAFSVESGALVDAFCALSFLALPPALHLSAHAAMAELDALLPPVRGAAMLLSERAVATARLGAADAHTLCALLSLLARASTARVTSAPSRRVGGGRALGGALGRAPTASPSPHTPNGASALGGASDAGGAAAAGSGAGGSGGTDSADGAVSPGAEEVGGAGLEALCTQLVGILAAEPHCTGRFVVGLPPGSAEEAAARPTVAAPRVQLCDTEPAVAAADGAADAHSGVGAHVGADSSRGSRTNARLVVYRLRQLTLALLLDEADPSWQDPAWYRGAAEAAAETLKPLERALVEQAGRLAAAQADAAHTPPFISLESVTHSLRCSPGLLGPTPSLSRPLRTLLQHTHAHLSRNTAGGAGRTGCAAPSEEEEVCVRAAEGWLVGRRIGPHEHFLLLDPKLSTLEEVRAEASRLSAVYWPASSLATSDE